MPSHVPRPAFPLAALSEEVRRRADAAKPLADNQCDSDLDVEVFGFAPVTVGVCFAPAGSKPFKEASRKDKVARKSKKSFKAFTLGAQNGCWTYRVKVGTATFDPQIRVDQ